MHLSAPGGGSTFAGAGDLRLNATTKEVDDVVDLCLTPAIGLTSNAARERFAKAPILGGHATGVPFMGRNIGYRAAAAQVATARAATAQVAVVLGARSTDLPGLHPRAAPV